MFQVKRVNAEAGLVRDEYTQARDAEEMDKIDAVAKAFGVKVVFKDKVNFGKDDAAIQGSVVEIEKGTDRALEYLIGHEIMHRIKELSPSSFKNFANAVKVSRFSEYAAELETTERVYEEGEDFEEEAICNMAGKIALDSKLLEKFIEQNKHDKNILQALLDVFKKIWNTVTKAEQRKINDAIYQLEKALGEGSKVAEKLAKEGRTETRDSIDYEAQKNNTDDGVKAHVSVSARSEVNRLLSDMSYNGDVLLRDYTPNVLTQIGIPSNPMYMNASHIRENILTEEEGKEKGIWKEKGVHFHGLGVDKFIEAIDSLDNPDRIYRWRRNPHNTYAEKDFIIITTVKDDHGDTIIVPFVIESKARVNNVYVDSNEIKTVYGKSGLTEYLNRYTSDKSLNRIKIKRSPSSSRTAPIAAVGLQTSSNPTVPQSKPVVKKDSTQNDQNNSSPTIKGSRKGGDNFATERKQSKDRQVVFNELAQEQANVHFRDGAILTCTGTGECAF